MIKCTALSFENKVLGPHILAEWQQILSRGSFVLGDQVQSLEAWFSQRCGGAGAVGVNSGTDALSLALQAVGVTSGDEVITVSNSFVATVGAIVDIGARPVLADVLKDETIDPNAAERLVSPHTRAIVAVHLRGRPCQIDRLRKLCDEQSLALVEDCAQAIGTHVGETQVGVFGDAAAFSLHPLKSLGGVGDGGMVVARCDEVVNQVRLRRNHGLASRDAVELFGRNSRLDEIQAGVLNLKTVYIDDWLRRRHEIANYYNAAFDESAVGRDLGVDLPGNSYYHFVVAVEHRDELRKQLGADGIETAVHYPIPVHKQAAWIRSFGEVSLPATEELATKILTVPCHPGLSDSEVEYVCSKVILRTNRDNVAR